jgi:cytochrome c oxidase cbb3-type subunit 1
MPPDRADPAQTISLAVARTSVAWLLAANLVGVLLAVLLLWPQAGGWMAPLSYGRWMPLHSDLQLYGWCALPVAGVLLVSFLSRDERGVRHARVALGVWSVALIASGIDWLAGGASGKLFIEWSGVARSFFPIALSVLWVVIANGWWTNRERQSRRAHYLRGVLLLALLFVPATIYLSSSTAVFPSVNPLSGGATGTSLLGSSLAIVLILLVCPHLLEVAAKTGTSPSISPFVRVWLAVSLLAFAFAGRGNQSHHTAGQIISLAILLPWPLVVASHWRGFQWSEGSGQWLRAALGWGFVLTVSGFVTFLPGISERLKFTNALVAHAHLAMAGLLTSINIVLLLNIAGGSRGLQVLASRRWFWLWHVGCATHVAVLSALGWLEGSNPSLVPYGAPVVDAAYGIRLASGVVMTVAGAGWLAGLMKHGIPRR